MEKCSNPNVIANVATRAAGSAGTVATSRLDNIIAMEDSRGTAFSSLPYILMVEILVFWGEGKRTNEIHIHSSQWCGGVAPLRFGPFRSISFLSVLLSSVVPTEKEQKRRIVNPWVSEASNSKNIWYFSFSDCLVLLQTYFTVSQPMMSSLSQNAILFDIIRFDEKKRDPTADNNIVWETVNRIIIIPFPEFCFYFQVAEEQRAVLSFSTSLLLSRRVVRTATLSRSRLFLSASRNSCWLTMSGRAWLRRFVAFLQCLPDGQKPDNNPKRLTSKKIMWLLRKTSQNHG